MTAVIPKEVPDENESHVEASERGGPSGTDQTHGWGSPLAVDEHPIEEKIDEIGGDQREGYGPDHVHRLDAAAHGEIEHERKEADSQRFHVGNREARDHGIDMKRLQQWAEEPDRGHEQRRHDHAEVNAVDQGAMAIFTLTGAESLGDQSVQANEQTAAEECHHVENAGADADRADGIGAVGQVADHYSVDDTHRHPANLSEDERQCQAQGRAHFGAEGLQAEHESLART